MAYLRSPLRVVRRRGSDAPLPMTTVPRTLLAYLLAVDVVAAGWSSIAVVTWRPAGRDLRLLVLMLALAVVFEELARRFTRLQYRLSSELKRDMTSVWTVAAAVALSPGASVVLLSVVLLYIYLRQHRRSGQPLYRMWFASSASLLSCLGAGVAARWVNSAGVHWPGAIAVSVAVLTAIAVSTVINRLLITIALVGVGVRGRTLLASRDENVTELSTLCLGGLVAVAALNEPWLCILVLVPMAGLQRAALVHELEAAALQDAKTGLLNAVAWEQLARKELAHAQRTSRRAGILIIDIDRFKVVNDRFGHLVGDKVLAGVARAAKESLRGYDGLGRFGGEEFVAVLPDADERGALVIAERVRLRVSQLQLTEIVPGLATDPAQGGVKLSVSIGVAVLNSDGAELPELLHAADQALYRAKWNGRNQVQLARRGDQLPDMINL